MTAPEIPTIQAGETCNAAVDMRGKLDSGELFTGTPTVAEQTTSDLTIANEAVNTATLTINGASVVAGQAVQFNVTGATAGVSYLLKITGGTDSTPAQTRVLYVKFNGVA